MFSGMRDLKVLFVRQIDCVSRLHQTFCDPRVAVFGELGMRLEGHRLLPMAPLSSVSKILQVR